MTIAAQWVKIDLFDQLGDRVFAVTHHGRWRASCRRNQLLADDQQTIILAGR
jgi:hypothetical protein